MTSAIEMHAQTWADRTGLAVFPTKSKRPVSRRSWKTATTTAAEWGSWAGATGYGVRLDTATVVIDIDDAAGLAAALDETAPTLTVTTARGSHRYYRTSRPMPQRGLDGIDVKTSGGYVIGPGSRHDSGHVYRVTSPPALEMAEWTDELAAVVVAHTPTATRPDAIPATRMATRRRPRTRRTLEFEPADMSDQFAALLAKHDLADFVGGGRKP